MTRILILGGSALLWALMMASLLRREVLPYFDYQAPPSYRDVLKEIQVAEYTKGRIEAAGTPVGEIETMVERLFDGTYRLRTHAILRARILGIGTQSTSEIPVELKSETTVDVLYRFKSTVCEIDVFGAAGQITAARDGDLLRIKVGAASARMPGGFTQSLADFPKEGMVGDMFQPFAGGGSLYVGKKWKIPTIALGPAGLGVGWLYAAVTDRETILWQEEAVDTFRVEIRTEATEEKRPTHISWCRKDGIALRQQMTFQSLVYDIVFVSRASVGRGEAVQWSRRHFGTP